jgi:hypothetical protein
LDACPLALPLPIPLPLALAFILVLSLALALYIKVELVNKYTVLTKLTILAHFLRRIETLFLFFSGGSSLIKLSSMT